MAGYDVFISYAPDDAEWVQVFAERLKRAGLRVAYDVLRPGDVVVHTIERAIRDSAHGILVFSPAAQADKRVGQEYAALIQRSFEDGRLFIPVVIKDVELPEFARTREYSNFCGVDGPAYDRQITELIRALRAAPDRPTPLSVRPPPGTGVRPEGPRRLTVRIAAEQVTVLPDNGTVVSHRPAGMNPRLEELRWRLESARRRGAHAIRGLGGGGFGALLAEYGRELGVAYWVGPAGQALASELAQARRLGCSLRLGLEVTDRLADLPWETLILPGAAEPLALHPLVQLFRRVGDDATPSIAIRGPLRILAVMAAPEGPGSGVVLDLEAELGKILNSVESARRGGGERPGAYVRILNQGTLPAIRDALMRERFHVLHISCHAMRGVLVLEDELGRVDEVDTMRFIGEALPADRGVPLLVLSGCSTALDTTDFSDASPAIEAHADDAVTAEARPDENNAMALAAPLAGFARGLTAAGVPAVLAMTASVSDPYATALTGWLYSELASRAAPEILPAFCDARRRLEEARRRLPAGSQEASLEEWATPALFLRGPSQSLYDPADGLEQITPSADPDLAEGVPLRKLGEFVGRRTEIRIAMSMLWAASPGVLLHGIGGVGKSSLAAELLRQLGPGAGIVASALGQTCPEQLLEEIGRALLAASSRSTASSREDIRQLASAVRQPQHEWAERLRTLAPLLADLPVILLLDNFEDNLTFDGFQWAVRNTQLAAFLTSWIRMSGKHKVLITSRFPFTLPKRAERRLAAQHLGPLSWPETRKLIWRLPGLGQLPISDQRRAWADVGGHPRTLEYLDALLRGGQARFADISERMEDLLERRGIAHPQALLGSSGTDLDAAVAEAITLAVDDTLLGRLLGLLDDFTRRLLLGASVFRLPVRREGVAWSMSAPANADPDRDERLTRLDGLLGQALETRPDATLDDLGLSLEALQRARADVADYLAAPIVMPDGLDTAIETLTGLGLLTPTSGTGSDARSDDDREFVVHRWTAAALARSEPDAPRGRVAAHEETMRAAHAAAAAYWEWQEGTGGDDHVAALLEAGYHWYAAGDLHSAALATAMVCKRLERQGAWEWEEQLYRDMLLWFPAGGLLEAANLIQLGNVARRRGKLEQALGLFRRSLTIAEELGDQDLIASDCRELGVIANMQGDYEHALQWINRSCAASEELGDRPGMADSYFQLGNIAFFRGDYKQALEWYQRSLTLAEELGDRARIAEADHQLGMIAHKRGNYEQALEWYYRSLTIKEELGDWSGIADTYHQLGLLAQHQDNDKHALEWYRRSVTICEELGDQSGMARGYHQLGIIAYHREDYERALEWYHRALTIDKELGDRSGIANCLHQFGKIAHRRGDYKQALDWYQRALAIRDEIGDRSGAAADCGQLGMLYTETGETAEAVAYTIRSLLILTEHQSPETGVAFYWLGRQRRTLGDEDFHHLLTEHLDAESIKTLIGLLDMPSE